MQADRIYINGTIHTLDPVRPHASAVAIYSDRILAVGNDDEIRSLLRSGGQAIDLAGRTLLPGFIDAHIHLLSYGLTLSEIDLVQVESVTAAQEKVRLRVEQAAPGEWLTGRGWDQSLWESDHFPHASDLDRVSENHPIFLRRKCGHVGWANSYALRRAGIDADSEDPPGGEIVRDSNGRPTGILLETAMELVYRLLEEPSSAEAQGAIQRASARLHEMGVTGVHTLEGASTLRALQELRERDRLWLRVLAQLPLSDLEAGLQIGMRSGLGDDWIRIGGVKIFSDGALGARTAWMLEPYEGEPNNRGIIVLEPGRLREIFRQAAGAGLAVFTHAIGDGANRAVLDAIESVRRAGIGTHLRHRIEHAQILHPDDLDRFAQLNVVASMQPIHCTQDMDLADRFWGKRSRYAYAWRSLLDRGAHLAFGSDAPVETPDVLQGIYAAASRRRPDGRPGTDGWIAHQRISTAEAVHAYTLGAAYAGGDELSRGSIEVGKLADLVVLSKDILAVPMDEILETVVEETVVAGRPVFSRLK